jgi:UDP-N-acetylmuramoyl-L-alanyl-D-glutamate--2,6-diaminopimelate ligase
MATQSVAMLSAGMVDNNKMRPKAEFTGLASDSRKVKPGYLFAALPGTNADGAHFVDDAARRGAAAVLGHPGLADRVRQLGLPFLPDENPRLRLAQLAAEFYGAQPSTIAAITGTNGKTSVAVFLRQIWEFEGRRAASLGTVGLISPAGHATLEHTTPDPLELHQRLSQLKRDGVDYLALEASSHGLDQFRIDGLNIAAVAFTNITRDHLDYHPTFGDYLAAKLRLFAEVVRRNGVAVVNADAACADMFCTTARQRDLRLLTVGEKGETLRLVARKPVAQGQTLTIAFANQTRDVLLPLVGEFQASNALVASGLALGLGDPADKVFEAVGRLRGAPGRLELVAYAPNSAPIYVDYAHTPDALITVLSAVRPHVADKVQVVFGCGGDRDKGKRPLMGAAAAEFADVVTVTDDNPRSEDAAFIRKEALRGCPKAFEIGDRAEAIRVAIAGLEPGDALVIAGKGHETGQIVGSEMRPFSDRDQAIKAAIALGGRAAESAK